MLRRNSRSGLLPRAAMGIALLALSSAATRAQVISGAVRTDREGSPVVGAVVILTATSGEKVRGALTGDDGRFRLEAPSKGTYNLRIDVVGYRSVTVPPFALGDSGIAVGDIRFPFERVTLPSIAVRASTSCDRVAGESGDAARLWSEARKTLEATRLAQEERRFPVTFTRYERTLALPDSSVQTARSFRQSGVTDNPFVSLPPDSIAATGYLAKRNGRDVYYGPDARVLLSDQFVTSHCFSTRRDGRAGWIGLAFRPPSRPSHIEVEGVLWLDSATAELRSLEYRYVPMLGRSGRGGGIVDFGRLPNGLWGVTRWSIRMPMLRVVESSRRPDGILAPFVDTLVTAVQEEGGEILTGVAQSPARGSMRLRGIVYDSTLGGPVVGALVTLEGAGVSVRSDSAGVFVFDSLAESGTFRARFWHPRLDSLGIGMPRASVVLRPGEETVAMLAVPGPNAISRERCGKVIDTPARVVAGTVRGGRPAEVVVLERARDSAGVASMRRLTTTTNDAGRFALCSLTPRSTAWVVARVDDHWTPAIALPPEHGATIVDLGLLPASGDSAGIASGSRVIELARPSIDSAEAHVEGFVLLSGDQPATPVQVLVAGSVASVASAEGTFRVERVPEGPRQVTFRAGSFGAVSASVAIKRGESAVLLVTLSPRPTVVATSLITSPAVSSSSAIRGGFEARRRGGHGVFFDRPAIERANAQSLADILRRVPGVRVIAADNGYRYQAAASNVLRINATTPSKVDYVGPGGAKVQLNASESGCDLSIFLDGIPYTAAEGSIDQQVRSSEIAAIEVYPTASSVPRQFAGAKAACGVIVIWRT